MCQNNPINEIPIKLSQMPAPLVLRHKKSLYLETNLANAGLNSDHVRF